MSRLVRTCPVWGGLVNVTAEQLAWQGDAACALLASLEDSGYRVRVVANNWSRVERHSGANSLLRVVIKNYSEPLQFDAMAAVLSHAGIYRTSGFVAKKRVA
jgi:hypothetical protein